jgi:hypothetical protein
MERVPLVRLLALRLVKSTFCQDKPPPEIERNCPLLPMGKNAVVLGPLWKGMDPASPPIRFVDSGVDPAGGYPRLFHAVVPFPILNPTKTLVELYSTPISPALNTGLVEVH